MRITNSLPKKYNKPVSIKNSHQIEALLGQSEPTHMMLGEIGIH